MVYGDQHVSLVMGQSFSVNYNALRETLAKDGLEWKTLRHSGVFQAVGASPFYFQPNILKWFGRDVIRPPDVRKEPPLSVMRPAMCLKASAESRSCDYVRSECQK